MLCGNRLFLAGGDGLSPTQLAMDLGCVAERISRLAEAFPGAATKGGALGPANEP